MSQFPSSNSSNSSAPAGSGTLVIIGGVIAVVAVFLMNVYVEMRVKASEEDTVTYFKFDDELSPGDEIKMSNLRAVEVGVSNKDVFGTNAVPEDPNKPGEPLDGLAEKLNQTVVKGQLLMFSQFGVQKSGAKRERAFENLDEITLNIDSKEQPPNLRPGDKIDLYASIPLNRNFETMRVMEYVHVAHLGDRVRDAGARTSNNKYGSITIYIDPKLTNKLFDIQDRIRGETFNVTRRDQDDDGIRELKRGGSTEINERVLEIFNLD